MPLALALDLQAGVVFGGAAELADFARKWYGQVELAAQDAAAAASTGGEGVSAAAAEAPQPIAGATSGQGSSAVAAEAPAPPSGPVATLRELKGLPPGASLNARETSAPGDEGAVDGTHLLGEDGGGRDGAACDGPCLGNRGRVQPRTASCGASGGGGGGAAFTAGGAGKGGGPPLSPSWFDMTFCDALSSADDGDGESTVCPSDAYLLPQEAWACVGLGADGAAVSPSVEGCPGRPPDLCVGSGGGVSDTASSCCDEQRDAGWTPSRSAAKKAKRAARAMCTRDATSDRLTVHGLAASLLEMLDRAQVGVGNTEKRLPAQLIDEWSVSADALFRAHSSHVRGARRAVLRKRFGEQITEALQLAEAQRSVRDTVQELPRGSPRGNASPR